MPSTEQNTSRKSYFTRDVLTLVTGAGIAQIIPVILSPVITRLYGPAAYGLFALFTSITSILAVTVCLRYESAIVLPRSDEEAANVFGLCIIILSVISILYGLIFLFFQQSIEMILKSSQIGDYFWVIPPFIFLSGLFLALNYWNTRTKQFERLAKVQVMKACATSGTQLGFGFTGYATGGALIGASLVAQLVSSIALGIQIMKEHVSFFRQHITIYGMIAVFKRYDNFPKYSMLASLLNTVYSTIPVFVLTAYFDSTIVGFYSLGLTVIMLPLSNIQSSVSQVFFPRAVEAKHISHEKLKNVVTQTIKPLIFIAYLPIIMFILIGPEIFGVVFGIRWETAGNYVRFVSIWMGFSFIASPISSLFSIFDRQYITVITTVLELILPFGAIILGARTGNPLVAIILFTIVGSIVGLIAYQYLLGLAGISIKVPAKIAFNFFVLSIPFIFCIIIFKYLFSANILLVVLLSTLIFSIFPLMILKKDPEISGLLKNVTGSIPIINKIIKYMRI
jgi:O-antigen/teichoic acid export membrane protein